MAMITPVELREAAMCTDDDLAPVKVLSDFTLLLTDPSPITAEVCAGLGMEKSTLGRDRWSLKYFDVYKSAEGDFSASYCDVDINEITTAGQLAALLFALTPATIPKETHHAAD